MDRTPESTIAEVFALQRAGRLEAAESACRAAMAAAPRSAPLHAALGRILTAVGRLPEAQAALGRALALDPDDRLALLEDANLARRQGDAARGERNLRRLVAMDPREARFGATLAQYLLGLGRVAEARDEAARAVELDPALVEARMALAEAEHAGGRFDVARHLWQALEAAHAGHPRVLLGLARASDRLRDRALSARCYDALLARDPHMAEALRGRIRLRLEAEDRAGAIDDAQRLLAVQPDAFDAWYAIALAHWQEHDLAPTVAALHEVLRRDPGHLPARWAGALGRRAPAAGYPARRRGRDAGLRRGLPRGARRLRGARRSTAASARSGRRRRHAVQQLLRALRGRGGAARAAPGRRLAVAAGACGRARGRAAGAPGARASTRGLRLLVHLPALGRQAFRAPAHRPRPLAHRSAGGGGRQGP
jgi:tetratricopeptide (TPR) repeat protein